MRHEPLHFQGRQQQQHGAKKRDKQRLAAVAQYFSPLMLAPPKTPGVASSMAPSVHFAA